MLLQTMCTHPTQYWRQFLFCNLCRGIILGSLETIYWHEKFKGKIFKILLLGLNSSLASGNLNLGYARKWYAFWIEAYNSPYILLIFCVLHALSRWFRFLYLNIMIIQEHLSQELIFSICFKVLLWRIWGTLVSILFHFPSFAMVSRKPPSDIFYPTQSTNSVWDISSRFGNRSKSKDVSLCQWHFLVSWDEFSKHWDDLYKKPTQFSPYPSLKQQFSKDLCMV